MRWYNSCIIHATRTTTATTQYPNVTTKSNGNETTAMHVQDIEDNETERYENVVDDGEEEEEDDDPDAFNPYAFIAHYHHIVL